VWDCMPGRNTNSLHRSIAGKSFSSGHVNSCSSSFMLACDMSALRLTYAHAAHSMAMHQRQATATCVMHSNPTNRLSKYRK
jgi:hypothetical protein